MPALGEVLSLGCFQPVSHRRRVGVTVRVAGDPAREAPSVRPLSVASASDPDQPVAATFALGPERPA
jgi:hypothetical protein